MEVGVADLGVEGEQHPRHLDHVVHVARLGGPPLHHVVQLPGLAEVLVAAVAAGIGNAVGAVCAGLIAEQLAGFSFFWGPFKLTQYRTLYLISGISRISCLLLLPLIRQPESAPVGTYFRRAMSLNPMEPGTYAYLWKKFGKPNGNEQRGETEN